MDVKKEIFSTLKQQFELAKIEEGEEGATVQILDRPVAPYEQSSPKTFLSIFLSMISLLLIRVYFIKVNPLHCEQ